LQKVDTGIDCNSDDYRRFRVGVSLFIALYQTIPLTWAVLLYRLREDLNPTTSNNDQRLALHIRDRNDKLDSLRFLFNDCEYWCQVITFANIH
jgi:hypothetical protein